jgi:glycosyltransferase involved in cell wall biosynthesis
VRVAQVVPHGEQPWSGLLTVIVDLSSALAQRGHHVEVWQLHDWSAGAYTEQRRRLRAAGVVEVPVGQRRRGRAVAALAEERLIDIVHLHGAFNRSNTAVSRVLRRPYAFSPHSGYNPISLERSRGRKLLYKTLFERRMLERAALLSVLTRQEAAELRAFGIAKPCVVIPNGVAPPMDGVSGLAFRRELGLGDDALLALFVGRLDVHRKGLDTLVDGLADAPGWHLALVGPRFRDVDRLERLIVDRGVGDRVHLVGERHGRSLQECFVAADLFALLSRWEGMPMALLEALAHGRPAVVSTAVESLVGVEAAGAGWATRDGELGHLLQNLRDRGRAELEPRSHAALELSRRFDWGAAAERYEVEYERALRSGRG